MTLVAHKKQKKVSFRLDAWRNEVNQNDKVTQKRVKVFLTHYSLLTENTNPTQAAQNRNLSRVFSSIYDKKVKPAQLLKYKLPPSDFTSPLSLSAYTVIIPVQHRKKLRSLKTFSEIAGQLNYNLILCSRRMLHVWQYLAMFLQMNLPLSLSMFWKF